MPEIYRRIGAYRPTLAYVILFRLHVFMVLYQGRPGPSARQLIEEGRITNKQTPPYQKKNSPSRDSNLSPSVFETNAVPVKSAFSRRR